MRKELTILSGLKINVVEWLDLSNPRSSRVALYLFLHQKPSPVSCPWSVLICLLKPHSLSIQILIRNCRILLKILRLSD